MSGNPSRRTLVAGVAVSLTGAASQAETSDLTVGRIARYRAACEACTAVDQSAEPDRYADLEREQMAAADAIFATPPTTRAGGRALAEFVIADAEATCNSDWAVEALKTLLPLLV